MKENQEKIDLIIKKEEEVIKIAANDCESKSSDSVIEESQINQESLIQQSNVNEDKTEKKNESTCKFFLRGNCKHGKK